MRAVLVGDLLAAARVLTIHREEAWRGVIDRMLYETHAAHAFCKRRGRPHPVWGNGSLMARAYSEGRMTYEQEYTSIFHRSLLEVLTALSGWRDRCATTVPFGQSRAMLSQMEDRK